MKRPVAAVPISVVLFLAFVLVGTYWVRRGVLERHLLSAIRVQDAAAVERLLRSFPSPRMMRDPKGLSALTLGADMGSVEVVRICLDRGISPDERDGEDLAAIHRAVDFRREGVLRLLLSRGADVNLRTPDGYGSNTPLHLAAMLQWPEGVRLLVAAKANVNAKAADGWTPLHCAAGRIGGNPEVVRMLLDAGADVNARTTTGEFISRVVGGVPSSSTPLHIASMAAAATLLLDRGADLRATDDLGQTPLHSAIFRDVAEVLIARGADVTVRDSWRQTPLHRAARRGALGVAEALIARGADVNARDIWRQTPLHRAARCDALGVAEALLLHGADLDARDNDGRTPLTVVRDTNDAPALENLVKSLRSRGLIQ